MSSGAYRHSCGAYVVHSARYGLYDADSARHHYCLNDAPQDDAREVADTCLDCGQWWVKFGNGPRLHPRTRQPHECTKPQAPDPPSEPVQMPTPIRQQSVEPPAMKPWRLIP